MKPTLRLRLPCCCFMRWLFPLVAIAQAVAQTISYPGGTLVENFDSLGPNGTNTPPGWFAGWSGSGVTFTTNITVGNGSVAPTSAAGWNFGTAGAADRALGVAATGSSTPTPPGANRFLEVRIRNTTPTSITAIHVRYDGEEWRTGSSSSIVNSNALQFSADGVNFTGLGPLFRFVQPVFTPVSTALDGNSAANRVANLGGLYQLPAPVPSNGVIYLRWLDVNDGSTEPALAMDNFLFFVPSNSPIAIVTPPANTSAHVGEAAAFSVAASGFPIFYQWRHNGAPLAGATNANLTLNSVNAADAGQYSVVVSNTLNSVTSSPALLTVLPQISFPFLPLTNLWRYDQSGNDLGAAWREVNYNDIAWPLGRGVFAFETAAAVTALTRTALALSNASGQRILTYYFRTSFVCTNDPATVYLVASNLVDDGAVAYLNGVEVFRFNMPGGAINAATLASEGVIGNDEGDFITRVFSAAPLVVGTNWLAVEVHQADPDSSDVVFGLALRAQSRTDGLATIVLPPRATTVDFGDTVALEVVAAGAPPLSYQWQFNGVNMPGQTGPTLEIPQAAPVHDGFYSVRVSNASNTVTTVPVRLAVNTPDVAAYYLTDFESGAGAEWSTNLTTLTPTGARRFLGEFLNDTVALTFPDLPPHTNVTVAFDLFIIRSWDGYATDDYWRLAVAGGPVLLDTSFSAQDSIPETQNFPFNFPTGNFLAGTGATETNSLGFTLSSTPLDNVYRLSYSFAHTAPSLTIEFSGRSLENLPNESWGLDNVRMTLAANAAVSWSHIVEQPQMQSVPPGSNAVFHVGAVGPAVFNYQWKRDGVNLSDGGHVSGATTATLQLSGVAEGDLGIYSVVVSNAYGALASAPAVLTFSPPEFHWARQVTGTGALNEMGDGVAMDGATHLYVSGNFETSANFGTTNVTASASGIFLARYTAAGALEWVRTGTSATAGGEAHNVAVDLLGNCYLTGSFMGTTSFGMSNIVSAGGSDVFVAKYDRAGLLLWVTRHGAGFNDSGRGIAADGTNGCFVTGILQTSSDANTARDIFFERYDASGALLWQQVPTGPASDAGMAAAADPDGNAFFTGWFTGTVNFGLTNLTAAGSLRDIFTAKFTRAGTLLWITQAGGANADEGKGIGVDTNGNVYVGGSLNLNFDGSNNAENLRVLKYSGAGALLWQRDLLAEFYFFDFSSVTDLGGRTWIFAGLHGNGAISGVSVSATGSYDGLVAKYDPNGALLWVKPIGGSGSAIGHRMAADVSGHAYLTGEFDGTASFGVTNLTGGGGTDFFLARLDSETIVPPRLALSSSNGLATVEVTGAPGDLLQIETTSALPNGWNVLTNVIIPVNPSRWSDANSLSQTQRFYRARLVP
jgi:hypothetical protein